MKGHNFRRCKTWITRVAVICCQKLKLNLQKPPAISYDSWVHKVERVENYQAKQSAKILQNARWCRTAEKQYKQWNSQNKDISVIPPILDLNCWFKYVQHEATSMPSLPPRKNCLSTHSITYVGDAAILHHNLWQYSWKQCFQE